MNQLFLRFIRLCVSFSVASLVFGCGGGGGNAGNASGGSGSGGSAASSARSILLVADKTTLKSDGTDVVSITLTAVDGAGGVVGGAALTASATQGVVLSASTPKTDATSGKVTITLVADPSRQDNRTSVLTVSCSSCTSSVKEIAVSGAGLSLDANTTAVSVGGSSATLTATVNKADGTPMPGTVVNFASTDTASLTVSSSSITTNAQGKATVNVVGLAASQSVPVNVSVLGTVASKSFAVTVPSQSFSFASPDAATVMTVGVGQQFSVSAPTGTTGVIFTSTDGKGVWSIANPVPVANGVATVYFIPSAAGTFTFSAVDAADSTKLISRTLTASQPVSAAKKVLLSAGATSLGLANATSAVPSVRLTARAIATVSGQDQGVANVPILFTMSGGPSGGEYLSPALVYTDKTGSAYADVYSGTQASVPNAIRVDAEIQGTSYRTGASPSSNPVSLTIGGQGLSVAFGSSTVIRENEAKNMYLLDYSVQVTDANNNPVPNTEVTLRVQPITFSTGSGCVPQKTFCSEDLNGNYSLDSGEDGVRKQIQATDVVNAGTQCGLATATGGSLDGLLTPQNSVAGAVPQTVKTGADGLAGFSHSYLKASAIWVGVKITATVNSGGTETSSSISLRLTASKDDYDPDATPVVCKIPNSPFAE